MREIELMLNFLLVGFALCDVTVRNNFVRFIWSIFETNDHKILVLFIFVNQIEEPKVFAGF